VSKTVTTSSSTTVTATKGGSQSTTTTTTVTKSATSSMRQSSSGPVRPPPAATSPRSPAGDFSAFSGLTIDPTDLNITLDPERVANFMTKTGGSLMSSRPGVKK
jgi:hypothetical protein